MDLPGSLKPWSQLQVPSRTQMTMKTTIVPKQPPPSFQAPMPEIKPLKRLFMVIIFVS